MPYKYYGNVWLIYIGSFKIEKHPLHLWRKQTNEINSRRFITIVIFVEAKIRVFQLHAELRIEYTKERQVGGSTQPTQVTNRKTNIHLPAVVPHCQQVVSAGAHAVHKKNLFIIVFKHSCMHASSWVSYHVPTNHVHVSLSVP